MKSSQRKICVAPMLDCTDRHERYLLRLITQQAMLYSEMVTTGAILHGDVPRHLDFNTVEHPLALQLGGSDPQSMAVCAQKAQDWDYDEVNINVGCPSDRVQSGQFGACLMLQPNLVADNVRRMQTEVDIPVTIKSRIGVDDQDPKESLWALVDQCAAAGCETFIIHARKAWLEGLSPKENRTVPELDYELVYRLKQDFSAVEIVLNGGVQSFDQADQHLEYVDGVMLGRAVYTNPFLLACVDARYYASEPRTLKRHQILERYLEYARQQVENGVSPRLLAKHLIGLFHGQPRAKMWRRAVTEGLNQEGAGIEVIEQAYNEYLVH